jgi:Tfp pilus assembly protein PilX
MRRLHRDQRGQSLVIVLSLITLLFLLGSSLAVHSSVALRATRASEGQGDDFYAADAATELGIWWQRNGMAGNPPAQTINGVTTSTTITTAGGGGGSCPAAPTVKWMNGFEAGVVSPAVGSAAGTNLAGGFYIVSCCSQVAVVPTPVRTGNYSLKVAPTSSNGGYGILMDPYANLGNTLVVHVSIRLDVLPTADAVVFSMGPNGSTGWAHSTMHLFYKLSSGKWALGLGNSSLPVFQESSVTIATGTWYSFDFRMQVIGTDTRMAEWYLDGVAQPTVSVVDSPGSGGAGPRINFGQVGVIGSVYTAYYDDVIISSTPGDFPIGDVRISPLVPDAMGTHNTPGNFQNNDNSAINAGPTPPGSHTRIDESPMNVTTDSIKQVTASATSYIEATFGDTTQTCIRGADAIMAAHPAGTSSNNTKTSIFDGATETVLYSGDISDTNAALHHAQRPITAGGAWSQARVNGLKLRLGYGADIGPLVSWDSVLVEVAYATVASGPATVTIVGTGGGSTVSTSYTDAGAGVPSLTTWTTTK